MASPSRLVPVLGLVALAYLVYFGAYFVLARLLAPPGGGPVTVAPTAAPAAPTTGAAPAVATLRPTEVAVAPTRPPTEAPPAPRTATRPPAPPPTAPPTRVVTATPLTPQAVVNPDVLNLRAGPGYAYDPPIDKLTAGTVLTVQARSADSAWLQVRTPTGKSGWVDAQYVKLNVPVGSLPVGSAPPLPTTRPSATPERGYTDPQFRADSASLRAGECTTLRWDVEGIQAVYLDNQGKTGHGREAVCPGSSRTYVLRVVERDGRSKEWPLTIQVAPAPTAPPAASRTFRVEYLGCIPAMNSPVKGQVFDASGNIIARTAEVEALVNGQAGVLPIGRTNQDGWYEWFTSPNQRITIASLKINGQRVTLAPATFEVQSTQGCFQHINLRQVP